MTDNEEDDDQPMNEFSEDSGTEEDPHREDGDASQATAESDNDDEETLASPRKAVAAAEKARLKCVYWLLSNGLETSRFDFFFSHPAQEVGSEQEGDAEAVLWRLARMTRRKRPATTCSSATPPYVLFC